MLKFESFGTIFRLFEMDQKIFREITPLTWNIMFPLLGDTLIVLQTRKCDIENSIVTTIDEDIPFVIETDTSIFAVFATCNQGRKTVAFFLYS